MDKKKDRDIENALADIITERPHDIRIGRKTLRIYPVTLAKTFMLRRWMDAMDADMSVLRMNPYVECLRLAEKKPDIVSHILAIHTAPNTRKDLHDSHGMTVRRNLLSSVRTEHLASLLMIVLTSDVTDVVGDYLGLDEENRRLREVMKVKREHDKNNKSFGGVSVFGTFIGQLKEMGYSDEEIIFERGYSYLRLMLADKMTNVYLSDKELENLPSDLGGTLLDGDDDASFDVLSDLIRNGGTK